MNTIKIAVYTTKTGKVPFLEWENELDDTKAQAIIANRLDRIRLDNFGDSKPIKGSKDV